MCCCVIESLVSDVSKEHSTFIFKGKAAKEELWAAGPLKMKPSHCLETLSINCPVMQWHTQEEQ